MWKDGLKKLLEGKTFNSLSFIFINHLLDSLIKHAIKSAECLKVVMEIVSKNIKMIYFWMIIDWLKFEREFWKMTIKNAIFDEMVLLINVYCLLSYFIIRAAFFWTSLLLMMSILFLIFWFRTSRWKSSLRYTYLHLLFLLF